MFFPKLVVLAKTKVAKMIKVANFEAMIFHNQIGDLIEKMYNNQAIFVKKTNKCFKSFLLQTKKPSGTF